MQEMQFGNDVISGTIKFTPVESVGNKRAVRVDVLEVTDGGEQKFHLVDAGIRSARMLAHNTQGIASFVTPESENGGISWFKLLLRAGLSDVEISDALRTFRMYFVRDLESLSQKRCATWFAPA